MPSLITVPCVFASLSTEVTLPDTSNMDQILREISAGKTYPALPFLADDVDLVMDIGANVGIAAIFFSAVYPKARVFAYEPSARTFETLAANAQRVERVTPVHAGLSDANGTTEIIFGYSGETSSLYRNPMTTGDSETIRLIRASEEFDRVLEGARFPVLKIDTEGSEVPVLRDLGSRIQRVAALYLEYHSEEDRVWIDRLAADNGLTLFSSEACHPHRGEICYVRRAILDERTHYSSRYIINHG